MLPPLVMKKIKKHTKKITTGELKRKLLILFLGSFIIRFFLAFNGTLSLDQNTFIAWGHQIAESGFKTFYNSWSDYLPGYLYILGFLAKIETIIPLPQVLLYKLPAILFDIASGFLVYKILRPQGTRKALFGASLILLNPAVLSNSTLWGQVDSISFFFPLLSIYLLPESPLLSGMALGFGALVKPQAVLAAPIILYLFWKRKEKFSHMAILVTTAALVFFGGFIPFLNHGNIISFALERLNVTISQYPYGSVNAFNFWGLWGFWQAESAGFLSEKNVGLLLFVIASVVAFLKFPKEKKEYWLLFVFYAANFLFFTRMHERHFLPAIMSLAVLTPLFPVLSFFLLIISVMYLFNMYYAYVWITENFREVFSHELITLFILLNIVSFVCIYFYAFFEKLFQNVLTFLMSKTIVKDTLSFVSLFYSQKEKKLPETLSLTTKQTLLSGILLFALITRLVGLGAPDHEYFDEVYHAFTAKVMLHDDPKAWEWWNPNPEGFAYEWTHPPVAKEVMALSMRVLGENSFAYRFPAAMLVVGAVFLLYKVASHLFNEEVGLLSSFVFSLDGLFLVMSRIGMNDMYVVFLILLTLLLFLKNKHFLGGLSLGLAAASKWTTLWFVPVLILAFLLLKKRFKFSLLWFVILPPLVYVATYIPMFVSGHGFDIFWGMQEQMWWYHTRLVATHPYSSRWWTWPLLLRPIWVYTSGETNGFVSNIYGMGNPLVFWGGLVSALISLKYIFIEKRKHLLLVLGAYLGLFMPWALSPRIMFFYHYFPAVPFLSILIGFVLYKNKKAVLPFLALTLVLFIYFYPHWAGLSVPVWLDHSYYWLPGWR